MKLGVWCVIVVVLSLLQIAAITLLALDMAFEALVVETSTVSIMFAIFLYNTFQNINN